MTKTPAWLGALLHRLAAGAPEDLLLLAPEGHGVCALLAAHLPRTAITLVAEPAPLPPARRHAAALVVGTLEVLAPQPARELLAALRDRLASHVLVALDLARAPLPEGELRALGYRLLARDGDVALFGFDLYDYKDRPDWLNAKFWAHPERWDKFRW